MSYNLQDFKQSLLDNDKDIKTIECYLYDIKEFLKRIENINSISNEDVKNYKNYLLSERKLNVKTVNRKLVAIKHFLTFNNITVNIKQEKVQSQNFLDDMLSNNDIERMIRSMEKKNDIRAITIVHTLRMTGMRISEMLQLTIDDAESDYISIVGKGKKHREIFVSPRLKTIWNDYLKVRNNRVNTDALFTGQRGAINRQTVHNIIKHYAGQSRIKKSKAHAHNFRHKFCKDLSDKGVTLDSIADLAGHQDINITRIYTRKTRKELMDIIDKI